MKKVFQVKNMRCTSCAAVIEADLEDAGIMAVCSYAKQTLEVDTNNKELSDEKIKQVVKQSGYDIV